MRGSGLARRVRRWPGRSARSRLPSTSSSGPRPSIDPAQPGAAPGAEQEPDPGKGRGEAEAPGQEGEPADALRVDRFGEERPGSEGCRRDQDEEHSHDAAAVHRPSLAGPHRVVDRPRASVWNGSHYTGGVTETTERAVAERVPALARETLRVVQRRGPLTVPPGTSLADCLRVIQ